MEFQCIDPKEDARWHGRVQTIIPYQDLYEIHIASRSSIQVMVGRTSRGGFACIPDFRAGCHLVSLTDKFWNTEQLIAVMGRADGITTGEALYHLCANGVIPGDITKP